MSRLKEYLKEAPLAAKGWTKKSAAKFGKTIGVKPGEHGFFDACVARMTDEMGESRAKGFCASIKDLHYGSTHWRGKEKSKKEIKKDVKAHPFKGK